INVFFTRWYNTIHILSKEHPQVIHDVAKPQDIDTFVAAKNNGQVLIDVALRGLIFRSTQSPQTNALVAAMNAFPSTVKYDSSNIETANPPVATALKTRLEQLLRHVESDLPAFLAMAAEGAFSPPNLRMGEDTYVVEIIPKSSEGGTYDKLQFVASLRNPSLRKSLV
ncbi:MAG: hypothetical protein LQ349_001491, partial [Xanthoria aureola]